MLVPEKPRAVAMGEVRTEYPGRETPLLTRDQHNRIAELARRSGLSEAEIAQRLIAAAQPSIDKVIDAALRLMILQSDSSGAINH